jgi:DNA modification methylase
VGKRSRRQNKDPLELKNMARTLESFGLQEHQSDGLKSSGPVEASSVRQHGDPKMAAVLAEALAASDPVDRATHSFHTYPARMHPDSAKLIIPHTKGPIHDPFCGGGTVLIEGKLAGRRTFGSDISPIAHLVAKARLSSPSLASKVRSASRKIADKAKLRVDVEVPEVCVPWYQHHVAQELGRIRDEITKYDEDVQPLLNAIFSSIVVKASFRKSDTSNKMEKHHRRPQSTAILFHKKSREFARLLETMPDQPATTLIHGDARNVVPPQKVGLILTSPPYPGVYDYLPMHQLRYAWLGLLPEDSLSKEIGSRRDFRSKGRTDALKNWQLDTKRWIKNQASILEDGAAMIIVVGDGLVAGKLVDALYPTTEAMKSAGLEIFARSSADRPDHARNAVRIEHMVMAVKPK